MSHRILVLAAALVALALGSSGARAQSESWSSFVTNAPVLTLPCLSSDFIPVVRGNLTYHTPATTACSSGGGGTPGGSFNSVQINNSGSFGGVGPGALQLFGWNGSGVPNLITLGSNLSMTGTTLNATGGGGSVSITGGDASIVASPSPLTGTGTITVGGPSHLTTFTAGTLPMGAGTSPFTASEITDVGLGGVVIGSPTGGAKGAGTINMAGCFINNVACAAGGSGSVGSGTTNQIAGYASSGTAVSGVTVSGDFTLLGSSGVGTLATVNSNVGTFASETVNGKGLVTAAGNLTGDATTSGSALTLATVNSNVGSFTNANITVNGKGLITAAANGAGGSGFAGYAGTTAGTANAQTIASPSPSGWTNTDQNQIFFKVGAGLTNTAAAPTLAISSQTAEPMDVQAGGILVSLPPGYLVAAQQYSATYQSACTCFVVTTTPNGGVTQATTSQAPTSALWAVGQVYNLNAASLTITPVVSTTLSAGGSIVINAINAGTLAATSPDTITTSAGTTGAGGNIALAAGTVTVVTSDGAGHLYAAGNAVTSSSGLVVGTTTITSGTNGDIEFNNSGVLGEKGVTGTGSVVLAAAPTITGAATFSGVPVFSGTLTGTPTQCLGLTSGNALTATAGACTTPVVFVGPTAGSANTYTIASPTPGGFALTNQNIVRFTASATNTGASTLNVAATGATAVDKQLSSGFVALAGGEIVSGLEYDATYNSTCTCFVLTNTPGSAIVNNATSTTVTAAQWANGTLFNVTSASQTITLPVATTLASNGGIFINAIGNSVTLAPNAADGINGGSTGSSVTISSGVFSVVSTVGSSGTGAITANPTTGGGGGSGTVASGVTPNAAYYASSGTTVSGYTHVTYPSTLVGVNYNATALPTALTGSVLQIANTDTTAIREELDAFGAQAFYTGRCFGGTNASPTAVTAGTQCGGYNSFLYNGTSSVGPLASFRTFANELQAVSGTHGGTYVDITATPLGSTTAVSEVQIVPSAGGSGGGGGAGVNFSIPTSHTPVALTDASTIAVDGSKTSIYTVTLTTSRTLGFPTNLPTTNQVSQIFEVTQPSGGGATLTLASGYNGTIVLNPAPNAVTTFSCVSTSASTENCVGGGNSAIYNAVALTDGATIAVNAQLGNIFTVTIAGNRTLGFPTNLPATPQQIMVFEITQDGTGGRTLTLGSGYTGTIALYSGAGLTTIFTCTSTSSSAAQCVGGAPSGSQLIGTATNDNATAGNIGEDVQSVIASGSAVSLATGTSKNVTSISLTAGDWDVCGAVDFMAGSSTVTTAMSAGISTTTGTLPTPPYGYVQTSTALSLTGNVLPSQTVPCVRESLASTTTVYLVTQATFSVSTNTAYGFIEGRRRR